MIYSSTCPCSAALARQLIQERFGEDFARGRALDYDQVVAWLGSEQGICATPHSQRSSAEIRVKLVQGFELPIIELIDRVESALRTPVQTAVKRVDEQAFARLNGENLMFCEDAARRVQHALAADERIVDFWVRASHYESLHPHNAVAVATKGVTGGYSGANGSVRAAATLISHAASGCDNIRHRRNMSSPRHLAGAARLRCRQLRDAFPMCLCAEICNNRS